MPAPVLAAAILLGVLGAIGGFGALAYGAMRFGDGGEPIAVIGGLVLAAAFFGVVGMFTRNRGAQIAAGVIGVFGVLGSITALTQGSLKSLAWAVTAAVIGLLAIVPVSSRNWFSR